MSQLLVQPTMHLFAVCATILVLKMVLTGNIVGLIRTMRGVYITPEDYAFMGKQVTPPDEQVERLRRAHQNDLENILPFLAVGFLFALTGGSERLAWWLFVPFTLGRVLHTLCYAAGLQPWRTITFEIGNVTLLVMTVILLMRLL